MKKVLVFAGSNSRTSINQMLVTYASTLLKNTEATVIELKDYPAPVFSEDIEKNEGHPETLKALNELFKSHDGFIISLPEYNSSVSPVFKNTVDWI
jgi:chromate reductase, NAD(P)H dehydrogenase (quinone)